MVCVSVGKTRRRWSRTTTKKEKVSNFKILPFLENNNIFPLRVVVLIDVRQKARREKKAAKWDEDDQLAEKVDWIELDSLPFRFASRVKKLRNKQKPEKNREGTMIADLLANEWNNNKKKKRSWGVAFDVGRTKCALIDK